MAVGVVAGRIGVEVVAEKPRLDIHNSDVPVVCRSCEARHKGICGALSPEHLTYVAQNSTRHTFARGSSIVDASEDAPRCGNVLGGVVKLSKLMVDGRQQIVGLQFAPDFVGRPFKRRTDVSAEAATAVRVCAFPQRVIDEIIRQSPEMEHRLYEQSLRELDEAREWMVTLGRKTASEKVASFLLLIAEQFDPEAEEGDHPVRFDLPLKRAEIADFLGLTIETVSRQLTHLRKAGVIEIEDSRTVVVDDIELLRDASETEQ